MLNGYLNPPAEREYDPEAINEAATSAVDDLFVETLNVFSDRLPRDSGATMTNVLARWRGRSVTSAERPSTTRATDEERSKPE
jgi:hypothetical protein